MIQVQVLNFRVEVNLKMDGLIVTSASCCGAEADKRHNDHIYPELPHAKRLLRGGLGGGVGRCGPRKCAAKVNLPFSVLMDIERRRKH